MRIVDAHAHFGPCRVFGLNITEEELIKSMDDNGVEISLVQPFPGAPDPVRIHDDIARLQEKYPGRIFGHASINPHQDEDFVRRELTRCVKELGFVVIKCHTIGHAVIPGSKDAAVLFETAKELKVPVMVHTGAAGMPFSSPTQLMPMAIKYPEIPIVLGHAGAGALTGDAIILASQFKNLYLETSWINTPDVKRAIDIVGADRVMMGSDLPVNLPVELAKYRSIAITEEERAAGLGGAAIKLFKLPL